MLRSFRREMAKLHHDDGGKMSVEMILLIAIIALPIVIALVLFRNVIFSWFQSNADTLKSDEQSATPPEITP